LYVDLVALFSTQLKSYSIVFSLKTVSQDEQSNMQPPGLALCSLW
jgi:hypothetical protein